LKKLQLLNQKLNSFLIGSVDNQQGFLSKLSMADLQGSVNKTEALEKPKLNPKQEFFCQLYATDREFFGNGTQSYIEAYDPDQSKPNWYNTARSRASELLTSPNVLARINELLDLTLNDPHVDKQLALVITQNADYSSKVAAIREYNKLKQRIVEKIDHTSGGKPIPILASVNVSTNNSNQPDSPTQQTNSGSTGRDISEQNDLNTPIVDQLSAV
jgi:Terminase small subunit